jgi:RNA polymerase sigma-70 factor (ECF subfamily)
VGRADEVDDLVAECLARAYAVPDFGRFDAGRAFLFQIARNLLIDAARREKVVSLDLMADLDLLQVDGRVEAGLQARDELRRLQASIDTLPIQCRRVFLLRRVYDRSTTEIAEEMGLSVSTVEKHLTKAVTRVMCAISDREEADFGRVGRTAGATADPGRGSSSRR